jgi:hypothetical protein
MPLGKNRGLPQAPHTPITIGKGVNKINLSLLASMQHQKNEYKYTSIEWHEADFKGFTEAKLLEKISA